MGASIALGIESAVLNSSLEDKIKQIANGKDPFEVMAELMVSGEDEAIRLGAAKELAKYLKPQLKSIDIKAGQVAQRRFAVVRFSDVDPQKAAELAKGLTPEKLLKDIAPNAAVVDHIRRDIEKPPIEGDIVTTVVAVEESVGDPEDVMPDDYPGKKFARMDRYGKGNG